MASGERIDESRRGGGAHLGRPRGRRTAWGGVFAGERQAGSVSAARRQGRIGPPSVPQRPVGRSSVSERPVDRPSVSQGRIGRPPVFGLELIGELGELPERPSERACDAVDDVQRGVCPAAFDTADGGLVEPGDVGERLLGEPNLTSAQADGAAECDLWCRAGAHAGNPRLLPPVCIGNKFLVIGRIRNYDLARGFRGKRREGDRMRWLPKGSRFSTQRDTQRPTSTDPGRADRHDRRHDQPADTPPRHADDPLHGPA